MRVIPASFEILEDLACQKIKIWAKNGSLLEHRHIITILVDWKRWAGAGDIKEFVTESIKSNERLLNFIIGFLSKESSDLRKSLISWASTVATSELI